MLFIENLLICVRWVGKLLVLFVLSVFIICAQYFDIHYHMCIYIYIAANNTGPKSATVFIKLPTSNVAV